MLILRDRLVNNPHNMPVDIAAMLAGKSPSGASPPIPGMPPGMPGIPGMSGMSIPGMSVPGVPGPSTDALEKQEAIHKKMLQRQTDELVTKAVDTKGKVDDWTVKTWLQL